MRLVHGTNIDMTKLGTKKKNEVENIVCLMRRYVHHVWMYASFWIIVSLTACANNSERNSHIVVNPTAVGVASGVVIGLGVGAMTGAQLFPLPAVAGGIMGGAIVEALLVNQTLADRIIAQGVTIIRVGDEFRMILPSSLFFHDRSTRLNHGYDPVLRQIAEFLRKFEKVDVEVAGYTDNVGPQWRDLALSRQQAQNLMKRLYAQGVDARMMYASGYAAADPIASNDSERGRKLNRRIEIRWRRLHDGEEPIDIAPKRKCGLHRCEEYGNDRRCP